MKRLTVHLDAEDEIRTAIAYYDQERPGLGREFRLDLEETFQRIQRSPGVLADVDDQGTRKLRLRRFPYTVYYVELEDAIWISAVAHQKRRPRYWKSRKPDEA